MFERIFYGLCGLPNFFSPIMTTLVAEMIAMKQAITYNDDVILQEKIKKDMWKKLKPHFQCLRSSGLKVAPNEPIFLRKVQFLEHIVSDKRIQPVAEKFQDINNLKRPKNQRDVMRISGSLGFYSTFIKTSHVDSKPFYELLRNGVRFESAKSMKNYFKTLKTEQVKKIFKLYQIRSTHSINRLILLALVPDRS